MIYKMKTNIYKYINLVVVAFVMAACGNSTEINETEEEEGVENEAFFSDQQFKALGMKVDSLPIRNLTSYVEANGQLEVPPQNEASVTAIIGANVTSIKVIEGDKIRKGQVLAYLSHPDLIKLQTDYVNSWSQLQFLEKEYERQKRLYEEQVGSGKEFQKIQADYQSMKGLVKGYEAQLRLIGLNGDKIKQSHIYEQVPVVSPINGYIRLVQIKTGQYVNMTLFYFITI
jgi:cobalt-zinc-cadmium efflux system membrane fusion protein